MRTIKPVILCSIITLLSSCVVTPLQDGDPNPVLSSCPPTPNCVNTMSTSSSHYIKPFELNLPLDKAWPIVIDTVARLPRTVISHQHTGYVHAKSYSKTLRFIDYFEVLADPARNRLHVRSSSMLGISDLNVNLLRTETFRKELEQRGAIKDDASALNEPL
jgi:uncharacterized protein (DUF1499 family)